MGPLFKRSTVCYMSDNSLMALLVRWWDNNNDMSVVNRG